MARIAWIALAMIALGALGCGKKEPAGPADAGKKAPPSMKAKNASMPVAPTETGPATAKEAAAEVPAEPAAATQAFPAPKPVSEAIPSDPPTTPSEPAKTDEPEGKRGKVTSAMGKALMRAIRGGAAQEAADEANPFRP